MPCLQYLRQRKMQSYQCEKLNECIRGLDGRKLQRKERAFQIYMVICWYTLSRNLLAVWSCMGENHFQTGVTWFGLPTRARSEKVRYAMKGPGIAVIGNDEESGGFEGMVYLCQNWKRKKMRK